MAQGRHKRDTDARSSKLRHFAKPSLKISRAAVVAAPVALVATAAAVTLGVAGNGPVSSAPVAAADLSRVAPTASAPATLSPAEDHSIPVSRSLNRKKHAAAKAARAARTAKAAKTSGAAKATSAKVEAARTVTPTTGTPRWTTTALNLWTEAGKQAHQDGTVEAGTKVLATGRAADGRVEILVDGDARWVTSGYLADEKPAPEPAGISMQPCPDSSVEDGLKPQTIKVYRSVCHAFPEVSEYGGWAARTEHDTGNALDVMVYGDKALGDRIAAWAQDHEAELDLYDLIWYDRIWTPVRSSEGWRDYGDHGSATANHMDHVHIGTN